MPVARSSGYGRSNKPISHYIVKSINKGGRGLIRPSPKGVGNTFRDPSEHPNSEEMPYRSTSNYLRQKMSGGFSNGSAITNKTGSPNSKTNKSTDIGRGTPAYKTPEEYYDEIINLKKQIVATTNDNSLLKGKLRKIEEENLKKEKQIEELLDPSKSDHMRRALTDRRPDAGTAVHSMKQKLLKLEQQLKSKESALQSLESDVKTSKIEDLKFQLDVFYQEIIRLRSSNSTADENNHRTSSSLRHNKTNVQENGGKIGAKTRALNETILRLNESNTKLQAENKSLKMDLEAMLDEKSESLEERRERKKELESMTRRELITTVRKSEQALNQMTNQLENAKALNKGGNSSLEKLTQKREKLLSDEITKLRDQNKSLIQQRDELESQYNDKMEEVVQLKQELKRIRTHDHETFMRREGLVESSTDPMSARSSRHASPKDSGSEKRRHSWHPNRLRSERVDEETSEHEAITNIQSVFRGHSARSASLRDGRRRTSVKGEYDDNNDGDREVDDANSYYTEDSEDEAVMTIQSALRGHSARSKSLMNYRDDVDDDDNDNFSESNRRIDEHARRRPSKSPRPVSAAPRRRGSQRNQPLISDADDDDDDDVCF